MNDLDGTALHPPLPPILLPLRGDRALAIVCVVRATETACGHARFEVRAAAWEAVRDCCLEEPGLRAPAVAIGLHAVAWEQLRAAAGALSLIHI